MHIVHVHIRVNPEAVAAFVSATLENVRGSVREPGVARFELLQEAAEPTRFVLVEPYGDPPPPTGADKTTVMLYMRQDHPGALLEILTEFAVRGVNLTLIQSRPTKKVMGDYFFTVDCEGHVADARVGEALAGLHRLCAEVRFLGSYARHDGRTPLMRPGTTNEDFAESRQWLRGIRGE